MSATLGERLHGGLYLLLQDLRGRPIRRLVRQLQAWEALDKAAYAALRRQLLEQALTYAWEHVHFYRSGAWRRALAGRAATELTAWPVLEKQVAIDRAAELEARPRPRGSWHRISSATSGQPLRLALDPAGAAWSWANEYRALQWHGIGMGVRTLISMHNMYQRPRERTVLDWVRNRKACFADHLTPERLDGLARCLVGGGVKLCWGLPSVMFQLARHVRARHPDAPLQLTDVVKVGGEPLYPFQRRDIQAMLGGRVVQNYGCTEAGSITSECPAGRLHVFDTHVHVEVFDGDRPLPPGEFGDLVVTSLTNRAMPLVRCRVGDRGRLSPDPCPCGMPHAVLDEIQGRNTDMLVASDGGTVHGSELGRRLDGFFAHTPPRQARQVQFQQMDPIHWHMLVEADDDVTVETIDRLAAIVQTTFGAACRITTQRVDMIPREPSGKFRYYRTRPPTQTDAARPALGSPHTRPSNTRAP